MSSSTGKKKHIFKLSGVKPDEIDKQYDFRLTNSLQINEKYIPQQSTKITELQNFKQNITFVDELKNSHVVKVSNINIERKSDGYFCFWDRHPFTTTPVYCPIEKIVKPQIKNYVSHINGKQYKIQDTNQDIKYHNYNTDGIFCSIECCLSFINDNKHNPLYQNSEYYLKEILEVTDCKSAPHWRLLAEYGGTHTIEEFRKSFVNVIYKYDGIIFNSICFLYRENYHL